MLDQSRLREPTQVARQGLLAGAEQAAEFGQGHAGVALDHEQRLVVDLVHRTLGPQWRRVGMQLSAREVKQLETAIELFLSQEQGVG